MKSEKTKEYDRIYRDNLRKRRASEGKCFDCEQPKIYADRCLRHWIDHNGRQRKSALKRIKIREEENRCIRCGLPLEADMDQGHRACLNCREWKTIPKIIDNKRRLYESVQG